MDVEIKLEKGGKSLIRPVNMESSINVEVQMNNDEEVDQSIGREIEQRDDQGNDEEVDQREIEKSRNGENNQRSGNSQLQSHVVGNQAVILINMVVLLCMYQFQWYVMFHFV